ncbi:hypothetical protein [Paenibacillus pinistramenti]|uniref:hypothetical protein n=1 Tax=Paenibacillus pinistramenti TaxID=1768003 RepID=UPI001396BDA1|nr:hypothetical protein [Paenibacillus pinistramenti]
MMRKAGEMGMGMGMAMAMAMKEQLLGRLDEIGGSLEIDRLGWRRSGHKSGYIKEVLPC